MNEFKTCPHGKSNYHNACGAMVIEMGTCYVWKSAIKALFMRWFQIDKVASLEHVRRGQYHPWFEKYIMQLIQGLQSHMNSVVNE